jgi:hypothetical protein
VKRSSLRSRRQGVAWGVWRQRQQLPGREDVSFVSRVRLNEECVHRCSRW